MGILLHGRFQSFVARLQRHGLFPACHFGFQQAYRGEHGLDFLQNGVLGVDRGLLPQIPQRMPGGQPRLADIRQLLPQQDLNQSRLTAAVPPDQAHLLPGNNAEVDAREQQIRAETFF